MTTPPPPVDFRSLVVSFAATADAALAQVRTLLTSAGEDPPGEGEPSRQEQIRSGLATARHLIDTLGMLEGKTKGNLTEPEQSLLRGALADLRMAYVKTNDQAVKKPA